MTFGDTETLMNGIFQPPPDKNEKLTATVKDIEPAIIGHSGAEEIFRIRLDHDFTFRLVAEINLLARVILSLLWS